MIRRWLITLLLLLLALLATGWGCYRYHTVPDEECSELYRRYADSPHVSVAFIRDFPVNDTLSLDVTTLTALDSIGWEILKTDFRIHPVPEFAQQQIGQGKDIISLKLVSKDNPMLGMDTACLLNNNTIGISRLHHTVSVFYTITINEQEAVLVNQTNIGLPPINK
ncbi:MAG: hypothetical protein ACSW8I_06240 [bacterium]